MQIPNAKGNYKNSVFDKNKQENVTHEIEIEIEIDKKTTHPLFPLYMVLSSINNCDVRVTHESNTICRS